MALTLNGDNTASTPGYAGSDSDTGLQPGTNELDLVTGGTSRLKIDSSGRVGIGVNSPAQLFDAVGTGVQIGGNYYKIGDFRHSTSSPKGVSFGYDNANSVGIVAPYGTNHLGFWGYNGSSWGERVRFTASGSVGIGVTSPQAALVVYNSAASMRFQNSTTGATATDGLFVGLNASNGDTAYLWNYENDDLIFGTNNSERARISSSGNVGIGTTNPLGDLTVSNGGASGIELQPEITTNTNRITNYNRSASSYNNFRLDAAQHEFLISGSEKARIDSAGTVRCGNNLTLAKRDANSVGMKIGTSHPQTALEIETQSGDTRYNIRFWQGSTEQGRIETGSGSTTYATSSDYRLKENIAPVTNGIERLQQLNPSRFNFIAHPSRTVDGFLAHEVQDIVPEAVSGEKDAVDDDGNPVYQGIDQSKLVPLLTAALQEAISEIEALKTRVAQLEGGAS